MKRYLDEPGREACEEILLADRAWVSGRHTSIEVRRNLTRLLDGDDLRKGRAHFQEDWRRMLVVELDSEVCEMAAQLAEVTGARSVDALHLAAGQRVGKDALTLITYDVRLAQAARSLGWQVAGV